MKPGRRVLLLGLLGLGGCGFRPMYGPRPVTTQQGLESIRVGLVTERNGQLLRRELEARLNSRQTGNPRYDLRVGLSYGVDLQGFARDGSPSRVRMTASATWYLYEAGATPRLLASGTERTSDAYNIPENQFFSADTARDATERRLVSQLAEDIVTRLAVRFENGPPGAA